MMIKGHKHAEARHVLMMHPEKVLSSPGITRIEASRLDTHLRSDASIQLI